VRRELVASSIEFEVAGEPPLKGDARSMLSQTHPHASRIRGCWKLLATLSCATASRASGRAAST
jgi:hypothetical protein